MNREETYLPAPLNFAGSALLFGVPTILLWIATHVLIPLLRNNTSIPPIVCWYIAGGGLVFVPMFIAIFVAIIKERKIAGNFQSDDSGGVGYSLPSPHPHLVWNANLFSRLRLRKLNRSDWLWATGGIIACGASMGLIGYVMPYIYEIFCISRAFGMSPSFMEASALKPGEGWIIGVWLVFFFFNIIGEELWWRGVILPRQEQTHGRSTWLIHGAFWLIFHISFGINLLIALLPILFILPWIVQKRRNTWIGIIIHGFVNGGGAIAVHLGWV